jgi:SAM-dependent methyltransferase
MENPALPEEVVCNVLRDLTRVHRFLGNTRAILRALHDDPEPIGRVIDLGCGNGALLDEIRARMGVEVLGVDLRPPRQTPVPVLVRDAVRDPLPAADVAVAVCLIHHLSDADLVRLIRNVGRSCRRFLILDLVRHHLPETLFRMFVAPWQHPINAADGVTSIRRSFTPPELRNLVAEALGRSGGSMRHTVAPLYVRQVMDIRFAR